MPILPVSFAMGCRHLFMTVLFTYFLPPTFSMTRQNHSQQDDKQGSGMTRSDAGRLGGETTRDRYGSEHFSEIGSEGGKARSDNR